jgi:hypothetical protein
VYCPNNDIRPKPWKLYLGKSSCYEFQINVGIAIINHVIKLDWEDLDRPFNQMNPNMCVPCECKKASFASIS